MFCLITDFVFSLSAGAGRTGAYIAIDLLTDKLQDVRSIDPVKEVMTMRENRKDMLQNAVGFEAKCFLIC